MKLDLYGSKEIEIVRRNDEWLVFYCGNEGKKSKAHDIVIPPCIGEAEVIGFIADLCHEWATPSQPDIKIIG